MAPPFMQAGYSANYTQKILDGIIFEIMRLSIDTPANDDGVTDFPTCTPDQIRRIHLVEASIKKFLARTRPFAAFDKGPPTRLYTDARLNPRAPEIAAARYSLRQYGTMCAEFYFLHQPPSPLWTSMTAYIPVVLEWVDLLHPMNRNIRPDPDSKDHHDIVYELLRLLDGILKPMDPLMEETRMFLERTESTRYALDLWCNLFRYSKTPRVDAAYKASFLANTIVFRSYRGPEPWSQGSRVPAVISDSVAQFTGYRPRRLCRTIARYGEAFRIPEADTLARGMFTFASKLMDASRLLPAVCPREAIRSIVVSLDYYVKHRAWRVVEMVCFYLERLLRLTRDHRALEWAVNDGLFRVYTDTVDTGVRMGALDQGFVGAVDGLAKVMRQGFVYWRVLRAFHRKNNGRLPSTHSFSAQHPASRYTLAAYEAIKPSMHRARVEWAETVKQRCSFCKSTKAATPIRACSCRSVYYCSRVCQKRHWQEHRQQCDWPEGQSAPRDMHFVMCITQDYVRRNERAIISLAQRVDPRRLHHALITVDLGNEVIRHDVQVEDAVELGEARTGTVIATWVDGTKALRLGIPDASILLDR